ncbi:MAG: hypothetical protein ABI443_10160 [Chthoniobacterales bacterium]
MKLIDKITKFSPAATLLSMKRAWSRMLHPLPPDRFLKEVDTEELRRVQDAYGIPGEAVRWPKYTDTPYHLNINIRRAQDLGLDRKPPMRILDIGSGAGYFLFVARVLGHSSMGMDLEEPKLYEDMFRLFGLQRVIHRVEKFQPLPHMGGKFDLITSFAIVFNNHSKPDRWGVEEWKYLLDDATGQLNTGGRIFIQLNPTPRTSIYYTPELRDYFLSRGAEIEKGDVLFPPRPA